MSDENDENIEETDETEKTEETEEIEEKKKGSVIGRIIFVVFLLALLFFGYVWYISRPILSVSPAELNFETEFIEKELSIKNVVQDSPFLIFGAKELKYSIETNADYDWIDVVPVPVDEANEGDGSVIKVVIDRNKIVIGKNTGEFQITSNGGNKTIEVVALKVHDSLKFDAPLKNSVLTIGERVNLQWSATSGVSDSVNLGLYLNNCEVAQIFDGYIYRNDNSSSGEYGWTLGESLLPGGGGYKLRIEDSKNSSLYDEVSPVSIRYPITEIRFENVNVAHQVPSTVQYIFSLRDQFNHAVVISKPDLKDDILRIWENEEEIDYLESPPILYPQDDFLLDVMLVLDFSVSMKKYKSGIETMVKGAHSLIDSLKDTHRIGVVEFHNPDEKPVVLKPFTTDKQVVRDAMDNFASTEVYNDFSICWDAVYKGLEPFPLEPVPEVFRALVFLSDGFDNSSEYGPDELISLANERDIHIYNIGVGEVHDEDVLKNISIKTGGTYVHAQNICVLLERFEQIIDDLGGQYKLTYITPKKSKDEVFKMRSEILYKGVTSYPPLEGEIDPAMIFGETKTGIVTFTSHSAINNGKAEFIMWCKHVPRYIDKFRFHFDIVKPFKVSLTPSDESGLCEGWSIVDEGEGWFHLQLDKGSNYDKELPFGSTGTICKIEINEVVEDEGLFIPFTLDNSIYKLGQSFYGGSSDELNENGDWVAGIVVEQQ